MPLPRMKAVGHIGQDTLWEQLNPHLRTLYELPPRVPRYELKARDLMRTSRRFDIPLKYQCVRHWQEHGDSTWISQLYLQHIAAFTGGSYVEGDGRKHSAEDYLQQFRDLIISLRDGGYDPARSLIPVNEEGECVDGSHRIAVAAYFDQTVQVVKLPVRIHGYDHRFFSQRGLARRFSDYVALQYCLDNPSARIVNLHPLAGGRDEEVESILGEYGRIFYRKELKARGHLPERVVRIYYREEPWIGDVTDGYAGARQHALKAFSGRLSSPVRIYVLSGADDVALREAKQRIRVLFGKGNYPVHINDDHRGTCELARIWFNDNSIQHLSHARERSFPRFEQYRAAFSDLLASADADAESYCVDGSAVMSAWGIRDCQDVDYLAASGATRLPDLPEVACHNREADHYMHSIDEMTHVPEHHFYHDGIKYLSLDRVLEMKRRRGEIPKDIRDARLISLFRLMTLSGLQSAFLLDALGGLGQFSDASRRLAARLYNRVARLFAFQVHKDILGWLLRADTLSLLYQGDRLYYRRGDVNIARLKRSGRFRTELQELLEHEARDGRINSVLDLGAAAGLSLLVLARALPGCRIFAMPLTGDDRELLQRSLRENHLETVVQFVAQRKKEAQNGDIDTCWLDAGSPPIDWLNVAEDYPVDQVPQAAARMLTACTPLITVNLRAGGANDLQACQRLDAALRPLGYISSDAAGRRLGVQQDTDAATGLCIFRYVPPGSAGGGVDALREDGGA